MAIETKTFAAECFEQTEVMVLSDNEDDNPTTMDVTTFKSLPATQLAWWLYLLLLDPLLLLADSNAKRLQKMVESMSSPTKEVAVQAAVDSLKPFMEALQVWQAADAAVI